MMNDSERNNAVQEFWVRHMSLVLTNDQGTYECIRGDIFSALGSLDGGASKYEVTAAAGEACQNAVYNMIGDEVDGDNNNTVASMLLSEFLGMGTDAWRELAGHFYELDEFLLNRLNLDI